VRGAWCGVRVRGAGCRVRVRGARCGVQSVRVVFSLRLPVIYFQNLSSRACEGPDCPCRLLAFAASSSWGAMRCLRLDPSQARDDKNLDTGLQAGGIGPVVLHLHARRARRGHSISGHPVTTCLSHTKELVILSGARNERSRRTTVTSDVLVAVVLRLRSFAKARSCPQDDNAVWVETSKRSDQAHPPAPRPPRPQRLIPRRPPSRHWLVPHKRACHPERSEERAKSKDHGHKRAAIYRGPSTAELR